MYRNWTCTLIFFTYLNVFLSWCFSVDVFWCFLILMFLLSGSSIVSSFQSFWALFVLQNTIFSEREETLIVYFQMICFRLIFWEKDISLSSLSPLSLLCLSSRHCYRSLKNGAFQSIVYMIKHVSFQLYRANPDGVFGKN